MGNTPNLSLPYPELTDTAHVPRDMKALADKLDVLLGGGGAGGSGGISVGANLPVLDVGVPGQVRAGRQLTVADFTSIGLTAPVGLFNLGGLTNLGTDARPLVNLGAVPFGVGINGATSTAAVFAGSTGQALYINDSGASDPFRITAGSFGGWFRTAKRGTAQAVVAKLSSTANQQSYYLQVHGTTSALSGGGSTNGTAYDISAVGITDVCDDRWHFGVITHDGATMRLYVDGALESTVAGGPLFGGSGPLNIGAAQGSGVTAATTAHYGRVDEVFVTTDVLTEDQVRSLYAAKLTHTLGAVPSAVRLNVHRRRRSGHHVAADFPTQPLRLHNFDFVAAPGPTTGWGDEGSNGVTLTPPGQAFAVPGVDGRKNQAWGVSGAHIGATATDTGLPGGLTPRSYGCWFKTSGPGAYRGVIGWANPSTGIDVDTGGLLRAASGADMITGPFVSDGQWHFAVVAEDNGAGDGVKRKLYLDGRLVGGSTVLNSITLAGANRFRIGAFSDGALPFTGQIDGAFVTGIPLTAAEIISLYTKGTQDLGVSPKNPGDHVERLDATTVLFIGDTLEGQHNVDVGVIG